MHILGWDIGGANLKASDGQLRSIEFPFPLWKQPDDLAGAIRRMALEWPPADGWAITMTGELADCYRTKGEGVRRILNSVREAADGIPVVVWTTAGEFVPPEEAIDWPLLAAAANWLALATWVGRMVPQGTALLVDTGSTTTDIIPIVDGFPDPVGRTDVERLVSGELVYSGCRRTPLMALGPDVGFRGGRAPLAAELFATSLDVYLLTGQVEESGDTETANGGTSSMAEAHDRLARMLCCDRHELTLKEAREIAAELAERQKQLIGRAIETVAARLPSPPGGIILSGSGEFLATAALPASLAALPRWSLEEILGVDHAAAACAFAVARLAAERFAISGAES